MEVFTRDNIRGRLRPLGRDLDIALLEDNGTFVVSNRRSTGFPLDLVIRRFARFETGCEVSRKANPGSGWEGRILNRQLPHFRIRYCQLTHTALSSSLVPRLRAIAMLTQHIVSRQRKFLLVGIELPVCLPLVL